MKKIFSGIIAVIMIVSAFSACGPSNITNINMIDSAKTLTVGKTYTLQYTIEPQNSNEKLFWTSSDEEIATVENGTVKALKAGDTDIKVSSQSGVSAVCNLTVKDIDITKVEISPASAKIKKGATEALSAKIYPSIAEGAELTWSSSDTSVATVSDDGIVTAVKSGSAVITATADNGKSGSASITVTSSKKKKSTSSKTNTTIVNYYGYSARRIGDTYTSDFVFYDSSYRYLTDDDVISLSYADTQKAINEIYARHGNAFSTSYWRNYFNQFSWYRNYSPKRKVSQSDCNAIEKANLNKLIKHRNYVK